MPEIYGEHFRRRGTASRKTLFRYEEEEFVWPEDDVHDEACTERESSPQEGPFISVPVGEGSYPEKMQTLVKDMTSFRSRRRKKRSSSHSHRTSRENNEETHSKDTVLQEDKETTQDEVPSDKKEGPTQDKAKAAPSLVEIRSLEETTTKDTPMPAIDRSIVSPDEERAMMDHSPTICRKVVDKEVSPHGKNVLEVFYCRIGASPFSSASEQDDGAQKLPRKRRFGLESATTKRKKLALQSEELMDALTSNAVDSPLRDVGESSEQSTILQKTLADLVKETSLVTKRDFFSHPTYTPFLVLDFSVSEAIKISQGRIGSSQDEKLHWFQSSGGEKHHFCLGYVSTNKENVNGYWNSKEGRYLRWTAHVLDWIQTYGHDSGRLFESFPRPLQIGASSDEGACVLRLGFTCNDESVFKYEILGTLEDLMHLHHSYNNGPIPETIVAWLVMEVLRCACSLHRCGVTHNDMGLDTFLLVRRKISPSENFENYEWFLMCADLGSAAIIAATEVLNEKSQNVAGWHFKHDLYSVANIANLLLNGGVPLSCKRRSDGSIDLPWKRHIFSNIYFRGQMAWEDLFRNLLNPTNSACGMHLVDFDTFGRVVKHDDTWPEEMTDACKLVKSVSKMDGAELRFLDRLMEHMHHIRINGQWRIPKIDRFPTKLIDNIFENQGEACRTQEASINKENKEEWRNTALEGQLSATLEERNTAASLLADKEKEVRLAKENCETKLKEAESKYQEKLRQQQMQADTRLQEVKDAFMQRLEMLRHDHTIEMQTTRQRFWGGSEINKRQMESMWLQERTTMQLLAVSRERELLAALARKDCELEHMKGLLSESVVRLKVEHQQQDSVKEREQGAANARLEAANVHLSERLNAQVKGIQKEKDKLQKDYERLRKEKDEVTKKNKEQEKQLRAALEESENKFDLKLAEKDEKLELARRRVEGKLNSAKSLVIILEKRLETAQEKILEAEGIRVQALQRLRRDHEEALISLKEQLRVETESQRAQLTELQKKLSDQANERKRLEVRLTELGDELSRSKAAMNEQSCLFEEAVQPLKDKISHLQAEVMDKDAAMKVYKERLEAREKAIAHRESALKSQRQSFELQQSQQDEGLCKRESDLQRRREEFEVEMHRRRSEWDQKTQDRQAREANEPQRSTAKNGASASLASATGRRPRGYKTREPKLSSLIIPGQSLSMAGVFQRISHKHGSGRLVIEDPSDDSEVEL